MDSGIATIRIEHGELLHTNSPYQMKLLAIASALHLLNNTDLDSATIWSDCLSAVTTINNMIKFSKIGIKNNHPLFTTIHSILAANPNTQLKWCKAHPDIHLQQYSTHQQWGNHLADLVAGGAPLPTDLINVHSSTTISALEVATYIQPSWYWTHANSPNILLSEPLNDARDGRWRQYQLNRDGPHVLNGEVLLHLGSAMEFSAGV